LNINMTNRIAGRKRIIVLCSEPPPIIIG
jgi:hypothetical protein